MLLPSSLDVSLYNENNNFVCISSILTVSLDWSAIRQSAGSRKDTAYCT